ncbi:unnamed protein product, partial [Medioppia subpectinata]
MITMGRKRDGVYRSTVVEETEVERDIDFYDTSCGIGNWRPDWLQVFATTKFFVINFSAVAVLQGAYFTYLIGSISTLEKRFAFESKISAFILIADNLSQMFLSPVVGYFGAKYNRSHLIAIGELVVGLSCIMSALPYFIYGPGLHLLSRTDVVSNVTQYEMCPTNPLDTKCGDDSTEHTTVYLAVVILWLASFANGIGYTAFYTIGLPYIDDNIKKKNSPIYISTTATLRLCGPVLGFLLSSISLHWYEDPLYDPHINTNDPRWTEELDTLEEVKYNVESTKKISKLKEIKISLKRLFKNPILIFHASAGICRYMEMQYRQSASSASFITGSTSIVMMAIGIMGGGVIIKYFKPKPRPLVLFMFTVELIASFSILSAMFFGCPAP